MATLTRRLGFSLIELLVAVLVMGVGVLGIVGLQVLSGQNNRGALEHSVATLLAEDMLERFRANPRGDYAGVGIGDPPAAFTDCLSESCTPADLAAFDVVIWKCALGNWRREAPCQAARTAGVLAAADRQPGLPGGDGAIAEAGGAVTITVTWQGPGPRRVAMSGRRG